MTAEDYLKILARKGDVTILERIGGKTMTNDAAISEASAGSAGRLSVFALIAGISIQLGVDGGK